APRDRRPPARRRRCARRPAARGPAESRTRAPSGRAPVRGTWSSRGDPTGRTGRLDGPFAPARLEPGDPDPAELGRHVRVEPELAVVRLEAEHRLDVRERRTGRP